MRRRQASRDQGIKGNSKGIKSLPDLVLPFLDASMPGCLDASSLDALPRGVIVGSAVISHVTNGTPNLSEWHLTDVRRYKKPRKTKRQPQPVWFKPF